MSAPDERQGRARRARARGMSLTDMSAPRVRTAAADPITPTKGAGEAKCEEQGPLHLAPPHSPCPARRSQQQHPICSRFA